MESLAVAAQAVRSEPVLRGARIVWHAIVALRDRRVVGFECLTRVGKEGGARVQEALRGPWGCQVDLDLVRRSLATAPALRPGERLFINLAPATTRAVCAGQVELPRAPDVVWEVSEAAVLDDDAVANISEAMGPQFAVDDLGTGIGDMLRLLDWRPPWIKLDRALVRGCHRDQARAEVIRGLVRAAATYGGRVVAEGLETRDELQAAEAIGLEYGQGFLFGLPLAPEEWRLPGAVLRGELPVVRSSTPHHQPRQ